MASTKRKAETFSKSSANSSIKKARTNNERLRNNKVLPVALETETDSDPIVESETTEHSGDDDGISWPSDDESAVAEDIITNRRGEDRKDQKSKDSVSQFQRQLPGPLALENGAENGSSSRETHAKQKVLTQERKAAKPNADTIARSKKLWERLRIKSQVPLEERKLLVAELFDIITGRVKDFVFKHDSVRIIQTALRYANLEQRMRIAKELQGEYRALSESKYAKFLVGKLLGLGDREIRDMVVPEFYGQVQRMIRHPEASWILDDIYRGAATTKQKAILLREWYGAEFAIFKADAHNTASADLKDILAKNREKRTPIMRSLHHLINQLIQKKTTGFTILHDAMLQYYLNVAPASEEANDFMELLKGDEEGDLLKNLAFTGSGARLVCLCLAYGNAKDRKHILKAYKGTFQALASDKYGHQVLLTAYDVIDDTVLVAKSIFAELFSKEISVEEQHGILLRYATDLNARTSILYPFTTKAKTVLSRGDLEMLKEIHHIRTTTSKKDPKVRTSELVQALSVPLLSFIAANAQILVRNSFGCFLISEVLLGAAGDSQEAQKAVACLTTKDGEVQAALSNAAAGRMLKTLVQGGHFNAETREIDHVDSLKPFADLLFSKIEGNLVRWATGANSFVIVGLLEAPTFSKRRELVALLSKHCQELQQAADEGRSLGIAKDKKSSRAKQSAMKGCGRNRGAELLLQKIK